MAGTEVDEFCQGTDGEKHLEGDGMSVPIYHPGKINRLYLVNRWFLYWNGF